MKNLGLKRRKKEEERRKKNEKERERKEQRKKEEEEQGKFRSGSGGMPETPQVLAPGRVRTQEPSHVVSGGDIGALHPRPNIGVLTREQSPLSISIPHIESDNNLTSEATGAAHRTPPSYTTISSISGGVMAPSPTPEAQDATIALSSIPTTIIPISHLHTTSISSQGCDISTPGGVRIGSRPRRPAVYDLGAFRPPHRPPP